MPEGPSNTKQILRQAYADLAKAEKIGDYERCLKTCTKILKYSPNDIVPLQCKVVTLIHLQKFEDALQFIRKSTALSKCCRFEKAYCEYRLNRADDALKTLRENADSSDFRCNELLAQLLYRMEKYDESYELYVDLLKNSEDDYDEERRANMAAVVAQWSYISKDETGKYIPSLSTYEHYYNEACRQCALGQYKTSIEFLNKSEELCRSILSEDDVPEEEIEDEVCCIKLQRAYCQQMMGKVDEALKTYLDISKQKSSDITLVAVASNNIVSLKKESNLFDARKKMKACQTVPLEHKLNKLQKEIICFNNVLVNLHSNQFEMCRRGIEELRNKFGIHEIALLCEAAVLLRQKETPAAIDILKKYADQSEKMCSSKVYYTLLQIYLNEGKISQAVSVLNSLTELKFTPGVLSLLVALHVANEDRNAAVETLSSAVEWFKKTKPDDPLFLTLLEECASLLVTFTDYKKATKYLEELRKIKPNDANILARLINTYVQFDPKKAEEVSRALPPMAHLTHDLDVDSLENAEGLLLGTKYGAKKAARTEATPNVNEAELQAQKKKRQKKRKTKLPKNYDPNVPPDPERWLPKYERSTYKKRKDKRTKDREISRGTQGAVAAASEIEPSVKPEVTSSPKVAAANSGALGPRQQRPAAQKPKKKKKAGGKW